MPMHIRQTTNINIQGGYPMMGFGSPMIGFNTPSIFGMGYPMGMSYPMGMACGMPSNEAMAGYCVGSILAQPGVLGAIGKGFSWVGKHVLKPVGNFLWNGIAKPVGKFVWNSVLKPVGTAIGKGVSWLWNNTLGRLFKKKSAKAKEA